MHSTAGRHQGRLVHERCGVGLIANLQMNRFLANTDFTCFVMPCDLNKSDSNLELQIWYVFYASQMLPIKLQKQKRPISYMKSAASAASSTQVTGVKCITRIYTNHNGRNHVGLYR